MLFRSRLATDVPACCLHVQDGTDRSGGESLALGFRPLPSDCPERGRGCLQKRGLAISAKVVLPGRPWPRRPSAMRRRLHEGLGHALPRGCGGGRTVDPEGPRGSPGRRGSWQLFVWIARAPKQNPQRSSLLFGGGGWVVCKLRRCRLRASSPPSMIRNADHPEDMPVGRSPHVDVGLEGELWP